MSMRDRDTLPSSGPARRSVVQAAGTIAVTLPVVAAYGGVAAMAGRYLYPAKPEQRAWMFVKDLASFEVGQSVSYQAPNGAPISIARQTNKGTADDFVALSSVCPHLGCAVHWEGQNNRFFCPCHNGVFDPQGNSVSGPPADAGQNLARYPLAIIDGLLFIEVSLSQF